MAVTTETQRLDAHKLRADFPVFEELINGRPVAFLDSAARLGQKTGAVGQVITFGTLKWWSGGG